MVFEDISLRWCMFIQKHRKHLTPNCINSQDNIIFFKCAFWYCFTNFLCRKWLHVLLQQTTAVLPTHLHRANGKGAEVSPCYQSIPCAFCIAPDRVKIHVAPEISYLKLVAPQKLKSFFNIKSKEWRYLTSFRSSCSVWSLSRYNLQTIKKIH